MYHLVEELEPGPICVPGSRFPRVTIYYIPPYPDTKHLGMSPPCVGLGFLSELGEAKTQQWFPHRCPCPTDCF